MFSPATPFTPVPIQILRMPVILLPAPRPMAVLPPPESLLNSAPAPTAVLPFPLVLVKSASAPTAVFGPKPLGAYLIPSR